MNPKGPVIGITLDIDDAGRHGLRPEYARALAEFGARPVYISPESGKEVLGLIDGLLIPGGNDMHPKYYGGTLADNIKLVPEERTDFELELVYEIIKRGIPVLGICYGMQAMNVALGGTLFEDIPTMVAGALDHRAEHTIELFDTGPLSDKIERGVYNVNSSHHQAVRDMGKGLNLMASSSDGIIEAFYLEGHRFFVGVEWHPERIRAERLSGVIVKEFVRKSYAG